MIWLFERRGAYVRCETREAPQRPGEFEFVIVHGDGSESVERFTDSDALLKRQQEFEHALAHNGWQGPFGRFY